MNEYQEEYLKKIRKICCDIIKTANNESPDYYAFKIEYNKLLSELSEFIDNEKDERLKSKYDWSYNSIVSYGEKGKGVSGVEFDFEKSIKNGASQKSKKEYLKSITKAAEHIKNDLDYFFSNISEWKEIECDES